MQSSEVKVVKLAERRDAETPAEPSAPQVEIVGHIDAVAGGVVYGWVWDKAHPETHVVVHVLAGDRELGTVVADRARPDLKKNAIGGGAHAFEFTLPDDARSADTQITVLAENVVTGDRVPFGRRRVGTEEDQDHALEFKHMQDTVDRLLESQRVLHRNMKAVIAGVQQGAGKEPKEAAKSAATEALAMPVGELKAIAQALHQQYDTIFAQQRRIEGLLKDVVATVTALAERPAGRTDRRVTIALLAFTGFTFALNVLFLIGAGAL